MFDLTYICLEEKLVILCRTYFQKLDLILSYSNIFLDSNSFERTGKVLNNFKLELLRAFGIWNFSLKQNSLADFGFEFLWVLEFMREMNCIVSIWNINQIRGTFTNYIDKFLSISYHIDIFYLTKDQLISKRLFGTFEFFQKMNEQVDV